MRSIFCAMAVAAIAMMSTGCTMSCKFSGPCRTLSQSCTLDQSGPTCTSCSSNSCGGDCGSTNCNVIQPLGATMDSGNCDGGCPNGLLGGDCSTGNCGTGVLGGNGMGVGLGLFQRGSSCGDGCGDAGCDGGCGEEVMETAGPGLLGGGGMMAGNAGGCGQFGCGMGGRLCLGCKWRSRRGGGLGGRLAGGLQNLHNAGHPYGGQVPHTPAPSYGGMMGAGGGTPSYSYPYYTTRGPRDFLNGNPPSIGR